MGDDPVKTVDPTPGVSGGDQDTAPESITLTPAQLNARLERERAKFADYADLQKTVEQLKKEKEEREQAEMSELEKARKQAEELKQEIELLSPFKDRWTAFEDSQRAEVEKRSEKLTEEQKAVITAIPDPTAQLKAIAQFETAAQQPGITAQQSGQLTGVPTMEEISDLRNKGDNRWRELYDKYRQSKGRL